MPPPTLNVVDEAATQRVLVVELMIATWEMNTSASCMETNSAPPAALLAPGLHIVGDDKAKLLINLQREIFIKEDCVIAKEVLVRAT